MQRMFYFSENFPSNSAWKQTAVSQSCNHNSEDVSWFGIAVKRAKLPASGERNPIQNALNIHHTEAEQFRTGTAAIIYMLLQKAM